MAFKKIVLWCEFPHKVDWKKLNVTLKSVGYKPEIYVTCTSFENYKWWAKEIKKNCSQVKEVNAWPVLAKNEGYWLSGFTRKDCIDRLLEYKGTKIKIDLEPPLPKFNYSNINMLRYLVNILFSKGKNNEYLAKTISELSKSNDVLVNEFPLPKLLLKRWGCYYPTSNKNIMCYTSLLKHGTLLRWWNFHMAKKREATMCSVGLIHSGIFGNEPHYRHESELAYDMRYAHKQGFRNIAVYSLDAIMRRPNPSAWLSVLKSFS